MQIFKRGIRSGLETTWELGKVIFPITLIMTMLSYTQLFDYLIQLVAPIMHWFGLPGEAAVPLVLANCLNLYAGIGAVLSLDLTVKSVFILAVMMSFSHNLFIESSVAAKVGINLWLVILVRVGLAVISAILIGHFWSGGQEQAVYGWMANSASTPDTWMDIVWLGANSAIMGILQLAMVVMPLMMFIQVLKDFNWLHKFSDMVAPLTKMLGMSRKTSTTLAAGLLFGLAMGAGVMIQAVKEDNVDKKSLYLAFIFLVSCHAVIEDTLIFIPLGIPVWPLLLIRLGVAFVMTLAIAWLWRRNKRINADKRSAAT